jgi:hypothetical protein
MFLRGRAQRLRLSGGRSGAGWGNTLDFAPHAGLARPDSEAPSPVRSYAPAVNEDVIRENWAGPQSDFPALVSHPSERASGKANVSRSFGHGCSGVGGA